MLNDTQELIVLKLFGITEEQLDEISKEIDEKISKIDDIDEALRILGSGRSDDYRNGFLMAFITMKLIEKYY